MSSVLVPHMALESSFGNYLWVGHPERIAAELYPDPKQGESEYFSSDFNQAVGHIFNDLEDIMDGVLKIPEWVEPDQFEYWIAGRAVKDVLELRDAEKRGKEINWTNDNSGEMDE